MNIVYHINIKDLIGLCFIGLLLIGILGAWLYLCIKEKLDQYKKRKKG